MANTQSTVAKYWRLIGPQRRELPRVLAASLALSFVDVLGIGLVGPFVASLLSPSMVADNPWYQQLSGALGLQTVDPVVVTATVLVAAFALKFIVSSAVLAEIFGFCTRLDRRLREELLNNLFAMDLSRVSGTKSSGFVQAVHGFTAQFAYGLVGAQLRMATEIFIGTVILCYLFYLNPMGLGLLLVLVSLVVLVYDRIFRKRIQGYGRDAAHSGEVLIQAVQQVVAGLREIRVYGIEARLLGRAKHAAATFSRITAHYQWISAIPKYLIEFCLMASVCVLVLAMYYADIPREKMFALMAVFGVAVVRLAPVANYVLNGLSQMRFNSFVIDRLIEEFGSVTAKTPSGGDAPAVEPLPVIETIELADVSFGYHGQASPVLRHVNLCIKKGDSIGLVGPSGGGKTTLAEMILGFWQPTEGEICINGRPRAEYSNSALQGHFAYIPQQLFLLDASIGDNISLQDPAGGDEVRFRIKAAASAAQLDGYLAGLELGIDAPCGESGGRLSGGQRQRIALARALYHDRSVIVMDEATSALDYETEREIIEEIRELKGRVTMIVIAHRVETVADCDRLFRVEGGAITEISRDELSARRSGK
ncbi:ATP-binding cassette domain-containing protein [Rhodobacterales bacterium LSUCC0031]|nr:ATP-binding cassette domain-containing protein [Rhodobacterales bacterium LSUCC0031]